VLPVAIVLVLFLGAFSISGIRIVLPVHIQITLATITQSLAQYLAAAVGLNLMGILTSTLLLLLLQKRRRV
jgi:hypothetical protein